MSAFSSFEVYSGVSVSSGHPKGHQEYPRYLMGELCSPEYTHGVFFLCPCPLSPVFCLLLCFVVHFSS
jgi:hypothetical protein